MCHRGAGTWHGVNGIVNELRLGFSFGMVCNVYSGVADYRCHPAVLCQPERTRGMCTGLVGRGCGDQPGEGRLCKIKGKVVFGLCAGIRGSLLFALFSAALRVGSHSMKTFGRLVVNVAAPMLYLLKRMVSTMARACLTTVGRSGSQGCVLCDVAE
jgi:hypothetical protein